MRSWSPLGFIARVRVTLGSDAAGIRQAFGALLISSGGDLLAGLTLASIDDALHKLPGLIVLIPAAIGMRGNIFGALGSRLGTAIHTGTFRLSARKETEVGQNLYASAALTLGVSLALAVLAKGVAGIFTQGSTISLADFVVISVLGGVLSSAVVGVLTLFVASLSTRRGWDMDNVAAPLVTAAGDVVTLPALYLATFMVGIQYVTVLVAFATALVAVGALIKAWQAKLPVLRRIVHESFPVLLVAGLVDVMAGLTVEKRLGEFLAYQALLVLVPPFLEDTGALGGILSSRLSSKLHLGIIEPKARPQRAARVDFIILVMLAVPVFVLLAISTDVVSLVFGLSSPGAMTLIGVTLIGGLIATFVATFVAYYGSIAAYRLGFDPDNHGIPLLTSTMDLVGALSLVLALMVLNVT
ncbi:MAG: magnesium transporter [Acidimicrobiales bacterium]|nr:magnesium transporter [Acidimicrobiales bacterium]